TRWRARLLGLYPIVQNAVARSELAQPMCVRIEARPNDVDAQLQSLNGLPSAEQGLQHEVAEHQLAAEHGSELVRRYDEHGARLSNNTRCTDSLAGQDI